MRQLALHAVACLLLAPLALAAPPQWGGTVTAASNHLLRGISRSHNDPSLSAELHAQSKQGWVVGLWAATSRVRQTDSTSVDMAATLGLGGMVSTDWAWRGSYAHYESPWQRLPGFYRYDEFSLDLSWRENLLLSASFSPNTSAYALSYGAVWNRNAWTYEATYQHTLRGSLRGYAGAGYYDLSALFGEGYWYGSAGLNLRWQSWQADLSYVHPDNSARRLSYAGTARRRALLQLSYEFGPRGNR